MSDKYYGKFTVHCDVDDKGDREGFKVELWNVEGDYGYCHIKNLDDPSERLSVGIAILREIINKVDESPEANT